jgi:oligosaccharide repeat unit polymerase
MVWPQALFFGFAAQLLFVALSVSYWRGSPCLTGWDMIVVSVLAGTCLRSFYFATDHPSAAIIDFYFLRGQGAEQLVVDAAIYAVAIGLLGIGFWSGFRRQVRKFAGRKSRIVINISNPDFARRVCRAIGACSVIALFIFAEVTGGLDLKNFSAKRGVLLHREQATGFENILRAFSYISVPAAVMHMGLRPANRRLMWWVGNAFLFTLAILPSIYTSSRQELFLVPILLMAALRLTGQKLNFWLIIPLAIVILSIFAFVSEARTTQVDTMASILPEIRIDMLDSMAINRNMLDYTRLANLRVARELDRTDYQYGSTYIVPFVAPIPRAVWPSKPVISPGIDFAIEVYSSRARGGIPPDGIAELYWNFGLALMLAFAPLLGAALGALDGVVQVRTTGNTNWFLYLVGPFLFTYRLVTISFAHALAATMQVALVAAIVFVLAGGKVYLARRSVM